MIVKLTIHGPEKAVPSSPMTFYLSFGSLLKPKRTLTLSRFISCGHFVPKGDRLMSKRIMKTNMYIGDIRRTPFPPFGVWLTMNESQ